MKCKRDILAQFIENGGRGTIGKISRELDISKRTLSKSLRVLIKEKKIKRTYTNGIGHEYHS
ncbi:MAG: helix-turn-helix domain-containing protein [Nanoarchaeota archaeon]|nr:helix-turn-helix domain-containing protein [Nanoarchaeota archaeon]